MAATMHSYQSHQEQAYPQPRNFTASGPLPLAGMPQERLARIAARRAFVEMKVGFMDAIAHLDDRHGRWLQHQVRHAQEPVDLWLLRGAAYRALQDEARCLALHRCLDGAFARSGLRTGFGSL
jgi:hypothetical protein